MKTKLDLFLDMVKPRERDVTFDTEGYTREQVEKIISAAMSRGLSAAYDGRFILVRDLRMSKSKKKHGARKRRHR